MISYINGKFILAAECEFTTAAYGKTDEHFKVCDSTPVTNTWLSFSAVYYF